MNENLINKLKFSSEKNEFYEELKKIFEDNYNDLFFEVVNLDPIPPFYSPLSESQNIEILLEEFSNCRGTIHKDNFIIVNSLYVYPLTEGKDSSNYLLVFDNQIENYFDEIASLCDLINDIFQVSIKNFNFGYNHSAVENANLISQMSHDINSMISLIKSSLPEINTSISDKMNYTEKMTKDILQYVREIQVLESEVAITELLNSIIQNVSIPENIELTKNFDFNSESICVDVELIDRAIGEIIKNSVFVFNGSAGKINIKATINDFKNLFYRKQFLVISIEDTGKGVNPDFLEFVKNPFFTTNKSEYHSGLGLSIANKIIEAHGGSINIQINQENNTLVTLYLPVQGKENE